LDFSGLEDFTESDVQSTSNEEKIVEELEWLVAAKATTQTYGLVLNSLIEQTLPLSSGIWYWDSIIGSHRNAGLYMVQSSPWRVTAWAKEIYTDAQQRLVHLRDRTDVSASSKETLSHSWKQFYGLVRESIRERSLSALQTHIASPVAMIQKEAAKKKQSLQKLRELSASALGVLMDSCLDFDIGPIETEKDKASSLDSDEWKRLLEKSVSLIETAVKHATSLELAVSAFEDRAFSDVDEDMSVLRNEIAAESTSGRARISRLTKKLRFILQEALPQHETSYDQCVETYGTPSRLVRYWLPSLALVVSSGTLLRIFLRRRADVVTWIREFGQTSIDFWYNWVVDPLKKIIATVRHDKDSEVAIMSKESLRGDRDSLERMVVDFAVDNPKSAVFAEGQTGGSSLSDAQISEIRAKVKEGDLTPVLRAYEQDLKKPFMGAIRGELVRALLIQVQKTKVDVEVALSGIDAILKSQELVFGVVGITPGLLVCFAVGRWAAGVFSQGNSPNKGKRKGQAIRVLRLVLFNGVPTCLADCDLEISTEF
jgi:nuclear-control-of-ATPase protein 2